jgi:mannose-6-phosphate isomerase-like protein (cupin superfamily)
LLDTRARHALLVLALLLCSAIVPGCAQQLTHSADDSRHVRNRFFVRRDGDVTRIEPPPHAGTGSSTAFRYFDDVTDANVVFRKRALHRGASIGMHVLTHDEVYYIVSGHGELAVDDSRVEVGPNTAIFMHQGADVGIRQLGDEDLVIIISYPPAKR